MPDSPDPPDPSARVRLIVALLVERGAMNLASIAKELGLSRAVVDRLVRSPLFENSPPSNRLRFRLSEAGRRMAEGLG